MGWKVSRRVACERCGEAGPPAERSADAEAKALKAGWLRGQCYGMALHLCPTCAARGLPEWWPDATGTRFHWEET